MPNTSSQNKAVKSIKDSLKSIQFTGQDFPSPIAYSFMYIQWEANEVSAKRIMAVSQHWKEIPLSRVSTHLIPIELFLQIMGEQLIRNLSLTFAIVIILTFIFVPNFQVWLLLNHYSSILMHWQFNARVIWPTSLMITHWIF